MTKPECQHLHLDASQPMGNGYIRCADCGRGIPIETAMGSLEKRLRYVEAQIIAIDSAMDAHMYGTVIERPNPAYDEGTGNEPEVTT